MEFRKLKATAEALEFMPEFNGSTWTDNLHRADYEAIEELFASIDRAEAYYGQKAVRYEKGEKGFLCRMTAVAEGQDSKLAADANYQLGMMYLGYDRPEGLEMPCNERVAMGFMARAAKLGHQKAREEYCLLVEKRGYYHAALQAVPEDKYIKPARVAYYRNCVRLAEAAGETLPPLGKDGFLPENDNAQTQALREAVLKYAAKIKEGATSLKQRTAELENAISDQVVRVKDDTIRMAIGFEDAKTRSKWIRRIVFLVYVFLLVLGGAKGPEETPALIYLAFLLPNTLYIFKNYEISSLQDYLSAFSNEDERVQMAGVWLGIMVVFYLIGSFLRRFFFRGGIDKFVKKKAVFLRKKGITQIAEKARNILRSKEGWDDSDIPFFDRLGLKDRYGKLDELAILYHMRRYTDDYQRAYSQAIPEKRMWTFKYTPPAWFRFYDNMQVRSVSEYGEDIPVYERYDKTCELIRGVKEAMENNTTRRCYAPLWDVESLWMTGHLWRNFWLQDYCETVLLELFGSFSDAGDGEASYRLARALYPSMRGWNYAHISAQQGNEKGLRILDNYEQYHAEPAESSKKDDSEPITLGGILQEELQKHDDRVRERNEERIDGARIKGDIDAEEAAKLKEKYGKRNR